MHEGVKLTWTTSGEINSSLFELERGGRADQFTTIGKVAASGYSSANVSYTFTDSFPASGTNYYRIKMIDRDLQYKYSPVLAVSAENEVFAIKTVYPNPFTDRINVVIVADKDGPLNLEIFDVKGKLVLKKNLVVHKGENLVVMDGLNFLQQGNYLLKAGTASMMVFKTVR